MLLNQTFSAYINELRSKIDQTLDSLVPLASSPYETLIESSRYSLLAPGKRLRPLITLAVAELYSIPIEKVIKPACAIELVHTYSLIHDDLPCMDDDDSRRGRPTLHTIYPEWQALLSGNLLLTKAFEVLSEAPYLYPEQKLRLIKHLAQISGADGLLGGQVMDLLAENKQCDVRYLQQMDLLKTGALISCSLEFGAIIAEAPQRDFSLFQNIGKNIGLAFQIIDDIIDIQSSSEELGKPAGSDLEKGKSTYPSSIGYETSKQWAEQLLEQAQTLIDQLPGKKDLLSHLANALVKRTQ